MYTCIYSYASSTRLDGFREAATRMRDSGQNEATRGTHVVLFLSGLAVTCSHIRVNDRDNYTILRVQSQEEHLHLEPPTDQVNVVHDVIRECERAARNVKQADRDLDTVLQCCDMRSCVQLGPGAGASCIGVGAMSCIAAVARVKPMYYREHKLGEARGGSRVPQGFLGPILMCNGLLHVEHVWHSLRHFTVVKQAQLRDQLTMVNMLCRSSGSGD